MYGAKEKITIKTREIATDEADGSFKRKLNDINERIDALVNKKPTFFDQKNRKSVVLSTPPECRPPQAITPNICKSRVQTSTPHHTKNNVSLGFYRNNTLAFSPIHCLHSQKSKEKNQNVLIEKKRNDVKEPTAVNATKSKKGVNSCHLDASQSRNSSQVSVQKELREDIGPHKIKLTRASYLSPDKTKTSKEGTEDVETNDKHRSAQEVRQYAKSQSKRKDAEKSRNNKNLLMVVVENIQISSNCTAYEHRPKLREDIAQPKSKLRRVDYLSPDKSKTSKEDREDVEINEENRSAQEVSQYDVKTRSRMDRSRSKSKQKDTESTRKNQSHLKVVENIQSLSDCTAYEQRPKLREDIAQPKIQLRRVDYLSPDKSKTSKEGREDVEINEENRSAQEVSQYDVKTRSRMDRSKSKSKQKDAESTRKNQSHLKVVENIQSLSDSTADEQRPKLPEDIVQPKSKLRRGNYLSPDKSKTSKEDMENVEINEENRSAQEVSQYDAKTRSRMDRSKSKSKQKDTESIRKNQSNLKVVENKSSVARNDERLTVVEEENDPTRLDDLLEEIQQRNIMKQLSREAPKFNVVDRNSQSSLNPNRASHNEPSAQSSNKKNEADKDSSSIKHLSKEKTCKSTSTTTANIPETHTINDHLMDQVNTRKDSSNMSMRAISELANVTIRKRTPNKSKQISLATEPSSTSVPNNHGRLTVVEEEDKPTRLDVLLEEIQQRNIMKQLSRQGSKLNVNRNAQSSVISNRRSNTESSEPSKKTKSVMVQTSDSGFQNPEEIEEGHNVTDIANMHSAESLFSAEDILRKEQRWNEVIDICTEIAENDDHEEVSLDWKSKSISNKRSTSHRSKLQKKSKRISSSLSFKHVSKKQIKMKKQASISERQKKTEKLNQIVSSLTADQSTCSSFDISNRPNIFDSLLPGDSLDFDLETSNMFCISNQNTPWRYSGRSSEVQDRIKLNFIRSTSEISRAQADARSEVNLSADNILAMDTVGLTTTKCLRSYNNYKRNKLNMSGEKGKTISPEKDRSRSRNRSEQVNSASFDQEESSLGEGDVSDTSLENSSLVNSKTSYEDNRQADVHESITPKPNSMTTSARNSSPPPVNPNRSNSQSESVSLEQPETHETDGARHKKANSSRNYMMAGLSTDNILSGRSKRIRKQVVCLPQELIAAGYVVVNNCSSPAIRPAKWLKKTPQKGNSRISKSEREPKQAGKKRKKAGNTHDVQPLEEIREMSEHRDNEEANQHCLSSSSTVHSESERVPPSGTSMMSKPQDIGSNNSGFVNSNPVQSTKRVYSDSDSLNQSGSSMGYNNDDALAHIPGNSLSNNITSEATAGLSGKSRNTGTVQRSNAEEDRCQVHHKSRRPMVFEPIADGCFVRVPSSNTAANLVQMGQIKVLPGKCKPGAKSRRRIIVYTVQSGCGYVATSKKRIKIESKCIFKVPKGVGYTIVNTSSKKDLLLSYSQETCS